MVKILETIQFYEQKYEETNLWKNKRIMVVDDEEFCISSFKAMMTIFGIDVHYHVDFCINGKEALARF